MATDERDDDPELILRTFSYPPPQALAEPASTRMGSDARPRDLSDPALFSTEVDDPGLTVGVPDQMGGRRGRVTDLPCRIGRYRIDELLGEGAFGQVFRARDDELERWVAIKVPHPERVARAEDLEMYLTEARVLASLDHPGIVPIFNVERSEDGLVYLVSKLIEGTDLAKRIKSNRPAPREATALLAVVAEALHHAHVRGFVHRDIKPQNILLDRSGKPYLGDFGLALKDEDVGTGPRFAGTPAYMSPEQARSEAHLVDGRSDIFSMGVVMYELLTGTCPFRGTDWRRTIERIATLEVRPPRQIDDSIPKELERICLKALSKRLSDRYTTALDLADDLRHALEQLGGASSFASAGHPAVTQPSGAEFDSLSVVLNVVPKGLRSFDLDDAEFFPRLLPGPYDRHGLPNLIRFWKTKIEEPDPDRSFRVGLVYGPSGCGKSSLVKAGILPRLARRVATVRVDVGPEGVEALLAHAIHKRVRGLPTDLALPQLLAAVRRGHGLETDEKLVIVLDQFEQWLHAQSDPENSELVQGLRQCDGERLQCLLIVRDDFWMSVTRFLHALDVRLVEGENSAAVDLFDARHACKVLRAFGQAFGALPESPAALSKDQAHFLEQAVAGLARDGKINAVQLSLFAEMVKGKPWTPATLKAVGGAQGVGVTFLEETFSASSAPFEHRFHQTAARAILQCLLPDQGTDIKGALRSREELLAASGYSAQRLHDFDCLVQILDTEVRLITPIDREAVEPDGTPETESEPRYQLTHDYLVPALRTWLTRKQKETRRGRAQIQLAERAALWAAKPETKQLPTFWEWLGIRILVPPSRWNERERAMMLAATRYHLRQAAVAVFGLSLAVVVLAEVLRYHQAAALFDRLFAAETAKVPAIIEQMAPYRGWIDPRLKDKVRQSPRGSSEHLHASLALLAVDPGQVGSLALALRDADPPTVRVIREALAPYRQTIREPLWKTLEDVTEPSGRRLRAACALALYEPDSPRWGAVASDVANGLSREDLFAVIQWTDLLRPVRAVLSPPLRKIFLTRSADQQGYTAAALLAEYAADQPEALCALIKQADVSQIRVLTSALTSAALTTDRDRTIAAIEQVLPPPDPAEAPRGPHRDEPVKAEANAALALSTLGRPSEVWSRLKNRADPNVRTYLILGLNRVESDPIVLINQLRTEPEPSIRQALVMALGRYEEDQLPTGRRQVLVPGFLQMYRDDPDPGVHSAIEWLMRRWSRGAQIAEIDEHMKSEDVDHIGKNWFINNHGHTFAVLKATTFRMGAPAGEPEREADEAPHLVQINRSFAIATKEVTVGQYLLFAKGHPVDNLFTPDRNCPVNKMSWYDTAKYCRWLSEQEQVEPGQMCYPPIDQIQDGLQMPADYLSRTGYRLPTEAEWESACRGGTVTPWFFGSDKDLLPRFGWYWPASGERSRPVGELLPNAFGLFDTMGNVYERCMDGYAPYPAAQALSVVDRENVTVVHNVSNVLRGGAFHRGPFDLRSAGRHETSIIDQNRYVGFRLARTMKTP